MLFENLFFGRRYIFRPMPSAVFLSVVVLIVIVKPIIIIPIPLAGFRLL